MNVKEVLEKTTEHFKQKGIESARLDAELLFGHALKLKRIELYTNYERPLTESELEICRDYVRRRSQGEPIAYICGSRGFYKSNFIVGPGVLIPRPETEQLVELVLEWVEKNKIENPKIVDMGTGSGCIALSLAKELPGAAVTAVDVSADSQRYYLENQELLNITNSNFVKADVESLVGLLTEDFDVVVSNPPYIAAQDTTIQESVKKYEPSQALFSGQDGLSAIRSWSVVASGLLKSNGLCAFEIGATQGEEARGIFERVGTFKNIQILKGYSKLDRIVRAEKK